MIPPRPSGKFGTELLTNARLAELLAREAEKVKPPLTRTFRRAARRAFLWPEEAANLIHSGRSLTELQSVGPYLEKVIKNCPTQQNTVQFQSELSDIHRAGGPARLGRGGQI